MTRLIEFNGLGDGVVHIERVSDALGAVLVEAGIATPVRRAVIYPSADVGFHHIQAYADVNETDVVEVYIDKGQRAWNPGSTKEEIPGPARIRYTRWADGGWSANVSSR